MTLIACGQEQIAPDECVNCGFWLHSQTHGGVPGPFGRYCDEECATAAQDRADEVSRVSHLHVRDLLCACPVCTEAGHPTPAELVEWKNYQEGNKNHGIS